MLDLPHVSQLRKVLGKIALGNPQKREDQFENFDFRSGLGELSMAAARDLSLFKAEHRGRNRFG